MSGGFFETCELFRFQLSSHHVNAAMPLAPDLPEADVTDHLLETGPGKNHGEFTVHTVCTVLGAVLPWGIAGRKGQVINGEICSPERRCRRYFICVNESIAALRKDFRSVLREGETSSTMTERRQRRIGTIALLLGLLVLFAFSGG